jgi:two-component system, OmpR family, phosphate regulon response regulator PhoB
VLAAMMDRPGRVLSRRQLLSAADRDQTSDRTADVYIAQLRAKLAPLAPLAPIRTVRNAGYSLDLP